MCVYDCQNCGFATGYAVTRYAEIARAESSELITGSFIACTRCASIDVDLYSDEGWQIELRAREVQERTPKQPLALVPGARRP